MMSARFWRTGMRFAALLFLATSWMCCGLSNVKAQNNDVDARVDKQMDALVATYKHFHENPELSTQEKESSALIAGELRKMGYEVTDHFGRYADASLTGYGVVGVLRNGAGPTVAIRT